MMLRSGILVSALATIMFGAAKAAVHPSGNNSGDVGTSGEPQVAQTGGSGGRGDGIGPRGTSPVPPLQNVPANPGGPGTTVPPDTPTGTGLLSPGTMQQGGSTRTHR